eukprot:643066_1
MTRLALVALFCAVVYAGIPVSSQKTGSRAFTASNGSSNDLDQLVVHGEPRALREEMFGEVHTSDSQANSLRRLSSIQSRIIGSMPWNATEPTPTSNSFATSTSSKTPINESPDNAPRASFDFEDGIGLSFAAKTVYGRHNQSSDPRTFKYGVAATGAFKKPPNTPMPPLYMPLTYRSYIKSYAAVSGSLLAFIAINHMHCVTHMSSVLIWLVLVSYQMLVPAQAQSMNGSSFSCTDEYECLNIQCNDDQDCLVQCMGTKSCMNGEIHGPSNANLVVVCSALYSCFQSTINGPTNGNLTFTCGGGGCIQNSPHIYCPIYGGCNVQCLSSQCHGLLLDARSMINGSLSVHSALGLKEGTIYCPGNDNECIIAADGANTLDNLMIYAVNGLRNVSLSCNASSCYNELYPV